MASFKEQATVGHDPDPGPATGLATGTTAPDRSTSWLTRHFPFLRTRRGIVITVIVVLLIIGGGLAGLAALPKRGGSGDGDGSADFATDPISSDEHFYSQSPPVYPSRTSPVLPTTLFSDKGC